MDEAAIFIGHDGVVFLDARPKRLYRRGHVPGAVSVDWLDFTESGRGRTGLLDPDVDRLGAVLGDAGVRRDDWAIVIGDPAQLWGEEGRIAWVLRYLGHEKVSIVNGGMTAWTAADLPVQRRRTKLPAVAYTPDPEPAVRATMADVRGIVNDDRTWSRVLVDVRSPDEYQALPGAPSFGAPRMGHVPGAVNLHWKELLADDGTVLPPQDLQALLIGRGVRPDASIVTYCTGGVRSAHTWYVLESLGYPSVRNYSGSWWEWSLDRRNPVQKGSGSRPAPAPPWPPEAPGEPGDDDDSAEEPPKKTPEQIIQELLDAKDGR